MSLRKAIDEHCKGCVYDRLAAGTWRQQTTLCSVTTCALWPHRPRTKAEIPANVLRYYGIDPRDFQNPDPNAAPPTPDPSVPGDEAVSGDSQATESETREGAR